ncbi:hypothetical protein [Natrinema soli]|uniref:Twin-arginine translocation signal domain-containing protein n=1 Tax=Natrinema soli TaxID=1930624 RepID=A0ABD5SV73_9EURY|nr:hypothetical protein [Natrinema soli]
MTDKRASDSDTDGADDRGNDGDTDRENDDPGNRGFVSRRRLLSALGAAGATGIGTGVAAEQFLGDTERAGIDLEAGAFDLQVHWDVLEGPRPGRSGNSDGAVRIPIEYDADHRSGVVRLRVAHTAVEGNNPAAIWLRGSCPESLGTLGEVATVTLSFADCDTGEPTRLLTSGSMRDVFEDLTTGLALDGAPESDDTDCLQPDAPVCLRLEWDFEGYVGGESATVSLAAIGSQCRHDGQTSPPFSPGSGCPPADSCPCCLDIGKLELEAGGPSGIGKNAIEPGTYSFTEGTAEYELRVTDTESKGSSETVAMAFELVSDDGVSAPNLCRVDVAGGPGSGPGPGTKTYRLWSDGPSGASTSVLTDASGGLLFAQHRTGASSDPNDYHAISHATVAICAADGRCD